MIWEHLLRAVLGPFSGIVERRLRGRFAIKKADQSFGHITQFIAEINETLCKNLPPGLVSSAGHQQSQAQEFKKAGDDYSPSDSGRHGSSQNW